MPAYPRLSLEERETVELLVEGARAIRSNRSLLAQAVGLGAMGLPMVALFAGPIYQRYGKAVAEKRHTPAGFLMGLVFKGIDPVSRTAREVGAPMLVASLVRDRLLAGLARDRENMDWSALALGVLDDAGLSG